MNINTKTYFISGWACDGNQAVKQLGLILKPSDEIFNFAQLLEEGNRNRFIKDLSECTRYSRVNVIAWSLGGYLVIDSLIEASNKLDNEKVLINPDNCRLYLISSGLGFVISKLQAYGCHPRFVKQMIRRINKGEANDVVSEFQKSLGWRSLDNVFLVSDLVSGLNRLLATGETSEEILNKVGRLIETNFGYFKLLHGRKDPILDWRASLKAASFLSKCHLEVTPDGHLPDLSNLV